MIKRGKAVYAFVDAANLFYGGEKSLKWKIDYEKLFKYLQERFLVSKVFYYAGIDVDQFKAEIGKKIDLPGLINYYQDKLREQGRTEAEKMVLEKQLERAKFYLDLDKFGYSLRIKPTKVFVNAEGTKTTKANCDVDLTFDMMRYMSQYSQAVIMSGDGDFAPVVEYLKNKNKKITILSRSERTAREMRTLAGEDYVDFKSIRKSIEVTETKATPVKREQSQKKHKNNSMHSMEAYRAQKNRPGGGGVTRIR